MKKPAPEGPEGLFGGLARARILGYLAQAREPKSGYQIAKDLDLGVSNVYPELKRLERWSVVEVRPDPKGRNRYSLTDEDLRRFLLRRVRVLSSSDWLAQERVAGRESLAEQARNLPSRPPRVARRSPRPQAANELRRPTSKDRVVRRAKRAARSSQ